MNGFFQILFAAQMSLSHPHGNMAQEEPNLLVKSEILRLSHLLQSTATRLRQKER
jgi:hypothetical protein